MTVNLTNPPDSLSLNVSNLIGNALKPEVTVKTKMATMAVQINENASDSVRQCCNDSSHDSRTRQTAVRKVRLGFTRGEDDVITLVELTVMLEPSMSNPVTFVDRDMRLLPTATALGADGVEKSIIIWLMIDPGLNCTTSKEMKENGYNIRNKGSSCDLIISARD